MQLDQYISDLLYRYECVILPGFGAFLTQYQSAQVHQTTNAFYPPKKKLSFNSQLVTNDGLLANYIAKAEGISHEVANAKIATYARALSNFVKAPGGHTLENIGRLLTDTEGNLQFEPSYHLNYLTASFGLSSYTSSQITRELLKVTPDVKVLREVYKEEVEAIEETTPIAITPERRNNGWIKYAAATVVGIGVLSFFGATYVKKVEEHNYASRAEAREQLEDKIQEATFVINNPLPAIQLAISKPLGKYHIVAGAFREEENALTRVNQLRDKGYDARQIGTNKYGLHQVVYGSFIDSDNAINTLREIRAEDNKTAWLLVEELD